jgi:hypothetical protein
MMIDAHPTLLARHKIAIVAPLALFLFSMFAVQAFAAGQVSPASPALAASGAPGSTFTANLVAAPGVSTAATGSATFTLSPNGTSLSYSLSVSNIQNVFMAHIHLSPSMTIAVWLSPNPNAVTAGAEGNCLGVLSGGSSSLCPSLISGTFTGVLAQGTITAADLSGPAACYGCVGLTFWQLVMAIESGQAFVNVHTLQNPGGEIQGTIGFTSPSSSSSSPQLAIVSQDTNGQSLPGYYNVLYDSSGAVVSTGFSPDMYSLTSGQTYMVGVENFGSCSFAAWTDGSTANPATVSITSNTELVATYNCGNTSTTGSGGVTVNAVDSNGNPLTGFYTGLWQAGKLVSSAFTPATFSTLSAGQLYSVLPENFGGCSFAEWTDGSVAVPRAFVATGQPQTFTAIYNCTASGTSTVNVSASNSAGAALPGYYIALWSGGSMVQSCFSPCSFTVKNGGTYQLAVADFGGETFSHWSDGTMTKVYTLTVPSQSTTISLTATYTP